MVPVLVRLGLRITNYSRFAGVFGASYRVDERDGMNDENQDLYALPPAAIKEPPHKLTAAFKQIGPGLILAASIVGTGELINTTSLGAKAGFSLLWLILLSCVIKVFAQVELGRYAITHGKTTIDAFDSLPGPRLGVSWLCWLWLVMMLTTQGRSPRWRVPSGRPPIWRFLASRNGSPAPAASWSRRGDPILRAIKNTSGRP